MTKPELPRARFVPPPRMGEDGPELIRPLERGEDGRLRAHVGEGPTWSEIETQYEKCKGPSEGHPWPTERFHGADIPVENEHLLDLPPVEGMGVWSGSDEPRAHLPPDRSHLQPTHGSWTEKQRREGRVILAIVGLVFASVAGGFLIWLDWS